MANEGKKKIYLTDEEKYDLIRLWEGEDVLYDVTKWTIITIRREMLH